MIRVFTEIFNNKDRCPKFARKCLTQYVCMYVVYCITVTSLVSSNFGILFQLDFHYTDYFIGVLSVGRNIVPWPNSYPLLVERYVWCVLLHSYTTLTLHGHKQKSFLSLFPIALVPSSGVVHTPALLARFKETTAIFFFLENIFFFF